MELNLKILTPLLQCTFIYRCALFITAKKYINFLFCVHITFWFFILSAFHSPCLSPHCLSISSFFLHRPPLHHRSNKPNRRPFSPLPITQAQPLQTLLSIVDLTSPAFDPFLHCRSHKLPTLFSIVDLTSSAATNPSLHRRSHKPSHHRPFHFALHSFRFDWEGPSHAVGGEIGQSVSVRAWFVGEDCETVPLGTSLVGRNQNKQGIGHGFWFGYFDFYGFLFCCSSLVLMGTRGLWLCSDFYGFDGGCGCVLVVEGNIILL